MMFFPIKIAQSEFMEEDVHSKTPRIMEKEGEQRTVHYFDAVCYSDGMQKEDPAVGSIVLRFSVTIVSQSIILKWLKCPS